VGLSRTLLAVHLYLSKKSAVVRLSPRLITMPDVGKLYLPCCTVTMTVCPTFTFSKLKYPKDPVDLRAIAFFSAPWVPSKMKSVADLDVDLARFAKMRTAECAAVIDEEAAVKNIDCLERDRPALAEFLGQCQVDGGVTGQMVRTLAIKKSRAVTEAAG